MIPPKTIKFGTLERILRRHGIALEPGGKHMRFVSTDRKRTYPIPFHKPSEDVPRTYVNAARRAFGLTRESGVSDEEFYGGG